MRRQLKQEFNNLLCEGTNRISSEVHIRTCLYGVPLSLHNHYSPLPLMNPSILHRRMQQSSNLYTYKHMYVHVLHFSPMAIVMATRREIPPCMCLHMYVCTNCVHACDILWTIYCYDKIMTSLRGGGEGGGCFGTKATP